MAMSNGSLLEVVEMHDVVLKAAIVALVRALSAAASRSRWYPQHHDTDRDSLAC